MFPGVCIFTSLWNTDLTVETLSAYSLEGLGDTRRAKHNQTWRDHYYMLSMERIMVYM